MRTVLYVGNSVCSNIEQLKEYFENSLSPSSPIYEELLTLYRDGILIDWLSEGTTDEERHFTEILRSIPDNLSNSDLMEKLVSVFTNSNIHLEKPSLSDYVDFELLSIKGDGISSEISNETIKIEKAQIEESSVIIEVKVNKVDNENFIIKVFDNDTKLFSETEIKLDNCCVGEKVTIQMPLPVMGKGLHHLLIMNGMEILCSFSVEVSLNETIMVNGLKFKMIYVERDKESGYKIGEAPVTQELWKKVMESNPSNHIKENRQSPNGITNVILNKISVFWYDIAGYYDRCPVEMVTYEDCQKFLEKLNELTGRKFRFPTREEWLFAYKGGLMSKGFLYSGSDDIDKVAWHLFNAEEHTHPVKRKQPNELGIYDMCGNVYEWCSDETDWDSIGYACGGSFQRDIRGKGKDVVALNKNTATNDVGLRLAISVSGKETEPHG